MTVIGVCSMGLVSIIIAVFRWLNRNADQVDERRHDVVALHGYLKKELDLHNLGEYNAVQKAKSFLNGHIAANYQETVILTIVTGRGNRSRWGQPVIKPAVEELLQDYRAQYQGRFRFGEIKDNEGAFLVHLQPGAF